MRSGGSLEYIENMRDEMVYAIQQGLGEIAKIQTKTRNSCRARAVMC